MLIGLTGKKGHGKTQVREFLMEDEGTECISFAKVIKDLTMRILFDLGYTKEEAKEMTYGSEKEKVIKELGVSSRHIQQTLGTEWGRELIHPDLWLILFNKRYETLLDGGFKTIVCDDVRFLNEVNLITSLGGKIIKVHRPDVEESQDQHPSEKEMEEIVPDAILSNDGTLEDLHFLSYAILEHLRKKSDE